MKVVRINLHAKYQISDHSFQVFSRKCSETLDFTMSIVPKIRKKTERDANLTGSEGGQDTSSFQISGHSYMFPRNASGA